MQFDVFANPLERARAAFPYVVVLQSDISVAGRDRVIAFLAAREKIGRIGGRLMPVVTVKRREFVVLMPSITNVHVAELRSPAGNLVVYRDRIVEAIDWLFLGL